jgi:hypothetical protein
MSVLKRPAKPAPDRRNEPQGLCRWKRRKLIASCFIEFNGKPVASVRKGLQSAVRLAGLPGRVTPHTLRRTAATWLMQRGVPIWEAAGFLGMSPEVLQDTYAHPHPDHLQGRRRQLGKRANAFRWLTREQPATRRKNQVNSGRSGRIRTCDPCVPNALPRQPTIVFSVFFVGFRLPSSRFVHAILRGVFGGGSFWFCTLI